VLSEEIGIRKPDPRIFQYAADALRIRPAECLYVGDSYRNDIIGAKTAGMQACWYNSESSTPAEMGIKADFIITKIGELAKILKN
jgi:putative hydrolase of the HAD superfamily